MYFLMQEDGCCFLKLFNRFGCEKLTGCLLCNVFLSPSDGGGNLLNWLLRILLELPDGYVGVN